MSCIDKRVLVSFTYMTDTDGFGMRKADDSAKTKALKGKTKSGMRFPGQKYDMHSPDYVGETKPTRAEIKRKLA